RLGLEPELVLEPFDDLNRAVARGAPRAVGHRDVGGLERAQLAQRRLEVLLPLLGLRREELEREDGLRASGDDLVDTHDSGDCRDRLPDLSRAPPPSARARPGAGAP